MALLITKDVSALGSLTLNQLYLRFNINYGYEGNSLEAITRNYISKESYLENLDNNLKISGIEDVYNFSYNNETDGNILDFVHNKVKDQLSTDITQDVSVLDSSTGEYINETQIIKAKFCDSSNISMVDISIN